MFYVKNTLHEYVIADCDFGKRSFTKNRSEAMPFNSEADGDQWIADYFKKYPHSLYIDKLRTVGY